MFSGLGEIRNQHNIFVCQIPKGTDIQTDNCGDMAGGEKYRAFILSHPSERVIYQISSLLSPGNF